MVRGGQLNRTISSELIDRLLSVTGLSEPLPQRRQHRDAERALENSGQSSKRRNSPADQLGIAAPTQRLMSPSVRRVRLESETRLVLTPQSAITLGTEHSAGPADIDLRPALIKSGLAL
ncbi:hypothetical protein Aab01nite_56770 [Paractinoplanes abujensis]|nr:hypothetical protein Aab01nite_56770 [Actinoplanes abujensis]